MSDADMESLYRAHFQAVYLYAKSLSRDGPLAEEIAAETFFKALQALDSFRGDCDIRTWLCQIAKNCYYSHLRKDKHLAPPQEGEPRDESAYGNVEAHTIRRESNLRMHKLLHGLNEPYREVFTLRVFAELSFKQIGDVLGKNGNWACVTFHRAKAKLRKQMEELP